MKALFLSLGLAIAFSYSSLNSKNVHFYGDSITYGVGASDNAHRWSTVFCNLFGGIEQNHGVSGMVMEAINYCSLHPEFDPSTIVTKGSSDGLLVFALGVNDIGTNNGHTPEAYEIAFQNAITTAFSKGWSANEILIIAPFNMTGYAAYIGYCSVTTAANDARAIAYRDASFRIAQANHTFWIDARQICLDNSGGNPTSWTVADGVHPNDVGHAGYANGFYNAVLTPR